MNQFPVLRLAYTARRPAAAATVISTYDDELAEYSRLGSRLARADLQDVIQLLRCLAPPVSRGSSSQIAAGHPPSTH